MFNKNQSTTQAKQSPSQQTQGSNIQVELPNITDLENTKTSSPLKDEIKDALKTEQRKEQKRKDPPSRCGCW